MSRTGALQIDQVEKAANEFFEPKLRRLRLAVDQIEEQTVAELQASLERVNDLMKDPASFGTVRIKITATLVAIIATGNSDSHIEVGILPILVERKAFILDRMNALRPEEAISSLQKDIMDRVQDAAVREELLRVLERHHGKQEEMSRRLEEESQQVLRAREAQADAFGQAIGVAKLDVQVASLTASVSRLEQNAAVRSDTLTSLVTQVGTLDVFVKRLEDKAISKWDVVTIVITIIAALGTLVGTSLGLMKWLSGG